MASYKVTAPHTFKKNKQPYYKNIFLSTVQRKVTGKTKATVHSVHSYLKLILWIWFVLLTVGPLLLSVKGIIDLAQMPPTILLPHPGGTGTPTLDRITYIPGAQPPFPPRPFNQASISPGEDPILPQPQPDTLLVPLCPPPNLTAP